MATLTITGTDFGRVAHELATAGRMIPQRFRRDLAQAARPMVRDMQRAIIDVSMSSSYLDGSAAGMRGSGGGGLRASIAGALQTRPSGSGVTVTVNVGGLGSRRNLPALIDGQGRWRHPVLGNYNAWVSQYASPTGWFTRTAERHHALILNYQEGRCAGYMNNLAASL